MGSKGIVNKTTVTLKDVVESSPILSELLKMELPIKTSYRISKLSKKIEAEVKDYLDKKNDLIRKYGKEDEKTKIPSISAQDTENMSLFNNDHGALLSIEIEFDFSPIPISELGKPDIEPRLLIPWIFTE